MEDSDAKTSKTFNAEIWIGQQLLKSKPSSFIADELIKLWQKGTLSLEDKSCLARFCLAQGHITAIVNAIKFDLQKEAPIPWAQVLEIIILSQAPLTKATIDAMLSGATRDKDLLSLSSLALRLCPKTDPRWIKIFESERASLLKKASEEKAKLIEDVQFFKREGLVDDYRLNLAKLLKLFPNDPDALKFGQQLKERDLEKNISKLKYQVQKSSPLTKFREESQSWPELSDALKAQYSNLDSKTAYELCTGLYQSGFFKEALDVYRQKCKQESLGEKSLEIEILLSLSSFVEALELAQGLIKTKIPDAVSAGLYYSARAFFGLEDVEQAKEILSALVTNIPAYRDASVLLAQWQSKLP